MLSKPLSTGPRLPDAEIDLLTIHRGSVTAPAGCGKTRLIADALLRHAAGKPILVLTHTNAGVGALRTRLTDMGVASSRYRLATIDGWTIKLIATFPTLSGHKPEIVLASVDYPKIRVAASSLLKRPRIQEIVRASYARLLVDEYQDCSMEQHNIVKAVSELIPTAVLGDPMQAIFAFRGTRLVRWNEDVSQWFNPAGTLNTPWRWINAGTEQLGRWLLQTRARLEAGSAVDVREGPGVTWLQLRAADDHETRRKAAAHPAATPEGGVLVIGDSKNPASQRELARSIHGATAVEAVDLRDLIEFAKSWDFKSPNALNSLIGYAATITRQVDASGLQKRLDSLLKGTERNPATPIESLALAFAAKPSHLAAAMLLEGFRAHSKAYPHRPTVLRACISALRASHGDLGHTLLEAAMRERERNRLVGRPPSKRAVGSTLLLKGLEASTVVIIDAHTLDRKNLYVAMTRGSHAVVICSPTPILSP